MDRQKFIGLSNSLQNLLFPPGKYTITQLLNLTPFFQGNITLQNYKSLMAKTFEMVDEERLWWVIKAENGEVEGKVLLIVLMLQLIGRQRRQLGGYNEASRNISAHTNNSQMNKLNSPRSKTNRALYISNQQILILNFIKENLVNFLKLLSNQPPNTQDPYLTAQQLQPLNILFKVDRSKQFSSYFPIFSNSHKLKASTISDHLIPRISISEQELLSLQGYSLSVQIKEEVQCRGKDVKIIGYYNSQVFIDSSVRSLYIVGCASCTIYVASCERIAFVDKCEKINLTVTTNLLRICNTVDSNIYFYGPSPIIMTGQNRTVFLGPNNSTSHELKTHMKIANIPINEQYFEMFTHVLGRSENNSYEIMQESDYDLLVMPVKNEEQETEKGSKQNQILLAPPKYLKELEQRNAFYRSFKEKLKTSNLNSDMMKNLHSAYQGHFKEWLIAKGYIKNMNDLVKMIDKK